jgi:hypothetical protein
MKTAGRKLLNEKVREKLIEQLLKPTPTGRAFPNQSFLETRYQKDA